ncbi:MAG: hypothetical protein KAS32_06380 [Candidatus Peribacteraceae bacterium]|nr:hypothetical protein [Candidatus Peribacteraceae bacterium]
MDANKLEVLKEVGYTVPNLCVFCLHSRFPSKLDSWGTCEKIKYKHKKHSDAERQLSITAYGHCEDWFEPLISSIAQLGAFNQFMEGAKNGKVDA